MSFTYPLARYRFEFEVSTPLRLPDYAGSTLRGSFGHALRQLSCATRAKTCTDCLLAQTCPYTRIFEPVASGTLVTPPVPYVIEPPQWGAREYLPGETLAFNFTLIGKGIEQLPLCIMAWQRAFLRGVGAGDGIARLSAVRQDNSVIYQPGLSVAAHTQLMTLSSEDAPQSVTLEFLTPLRLQENGHALPPSKLTPRPLLTALMRRVSLLTAQEQLFSQPVAQLAHLADGIEGQVDMEWRDWTRRSSRQQCTMQLGGCIGHWTLTGDLAPFWNFLRLGVDLHVGKEASFGLGQYRLLLNTESCPGKLALRDKPVLRKSLRAFDKHR